MPGLPSLPGEVDPSSTSESFVILKNRRDKWRRKKLRHLANRDENEDETTGPRATDLVREDVYLMDNKARRLHINLLANSLTMRLRKNLPDDPNIQQSTMRKIRRDSLKDFVRLDNLNKQYTCEMNWESNRLTKESHKLIKRHNKLHQQSEQERRKQERLESSLRSRSELSSASLFPRLLESEASFSEAPYAEDEFPEFAKVDKDDLSHVKVFKLKGIFQPQNKYSSRIEPFEIKAKVKPKTNDLQESLKMADSDSPVDLPTRSRMSKKNLRVTWSSQSRYYSNSDEDADSVITPSRADTRASRPDTRLDNATPDREDARKTPSSVKSFKSIHSDSILLKRRFKKPADKLETVGIQWKVPKGDQKQERSIPSPIKMLPGEHSRVLAPVTAALDREGLSPNKMRWHVQKAQNLSTAQMYQSWLEKMEQLKSSNPICPSPIQKIPKRTYLSAMANPISTHV